jgi:hypothetical protein
MSNGVRSKKFVNLYKEPSNIHEVMAGPWKDIRLEVIEAGGTLELASAELEHAGFVISGTGTLTNGDGLEFTLERSKAFAIPSKGRATITAVEEITLLHIEMHIEW